MKMEVVLSSPGLYEDDGTPFNNEEIREWSGVDRITGMLERARIETGRWRAYDKNAAHSYGKVVDSRERNSADGSIIQKARRQVEVFQSQGPGRSVQVVRASQWSSSRVTDSIELPFSSVISPWQHSSLTPSPSPSKKYPVSKNISPKRSSSDEDLSLNCDEMSSSIFARDCKSRRSLQIPVINSEDSCSKNEEQTKDEKNSLKSDGEMYLNISPISGKKGSSITIKAPSTKTSRPLVTVVNLMNPETFQEKKTTGNKSSIITLRPLKKSPEPRRDSLTKTNSSDDAVSLPGRTTKKVGFCKTEIHFAADSGKVNIVETDEKPPPTNKFRRRRRNHSLISPPETQSSFKKTGEVDTSGAYCVVDLETKKFWANPDEKNDGNNRIHTTTINLGDLNSINTRKVVEELKPIENLTSPKVVSEVISRSKTAEKNQSESNVVTKDSDNNQVLSTIVTTHETTIARVEDNLPVLKKKTEEKTIESRSSNIVKNDNNKKSKKQQEKKSPVYANVFGNVGDRFPVYENYRIESGKIKGPVEKNLKVRNVGIPIDIKKISTETKKNESERSKGILEKKKSVKSPSRIIKRSPASTMRSSSLTGSKNQRDLTKIKGTRKMSGESSSRSTESNSVSVKKPMEVVYKTAVYNMKNEKLTKPTEAKTIKPGPRLINDFICGGKTKRISTTTKRKGASSQSSKGATQTSRHWK